MPVLILLMEQNALADLLGVKIFLDACLLKHPALVWAEDMKVIPNCCHHTNNDQLLWKRGILSSYKF